MQEIAVYSVSGDIIDNLVQWDTDVYVYVTDSDIDTAYQMHFFNTTMDESLVVNTEYSDGTLKAKIPNVLLTQPHAIIGYIKTRESKNVEEKCLYRFRINVIKRPKPSDFVYVKSDDYVSITYVLEECREYADSAESSASDASKSATMSKSYAVGGTSTRQNEDKDNASYYYTQAKTSETNAKSSENKAKTSETNAANSEKNAKASEVAAKESETTAKAEATKAVNSASAAKTSEANAKASENASKSSEETALEAASDSSESAKQSAASASASQNSANAAKTSETNAKSSETNAKSSETSAASSEDEAKNYSDLSKSYAIGTNGEVRDNDDSDNAKYYYELSVELCKSLNGAILPRGTITSEQFFALGNAEKLAGYMYNISDGFTTDDSFKEGAGHIYPNGSNVYYTTDGYWDCFSGTMDDLLQTISDLKSTVESLENMLFNKEVHIGLCTDNGTSIATSSGEGIDAWWKLLTS